MKKSDKFVKEYWSRLDKDRFSREQSFLHEHRNEIGRCPYCNGSIKDRKVTLYKGLIDALYRVYCWCGKNRRHEFRTKDIKNFLGKNEYNRFGDLVRFGGIVYKPRLQGETEKAWYGINMGRAKEFFSGTREIPLQITLDQMTGEIIDEVRCGVNDFPELSALLTKEGLYDYDIPVQSVPKL